MPETTAVATVPRRFTPDTQTEAWGYLRGCLLALGASSSFAAARAGVINGPTPGNLIPMWFGVAGVVLLPLLPMVMQALARGSMQGVVALIAYSRAIRVLGVSRAVLFPAMVPAVSILVGIHRGRSPQCYPNHRPAARDHRPYVCNRRIPMDGSFEKIMAALNCIRSAR